MHNLQTFENDNSISLETSKQKSTWPGGFPQTTINTQDSFCEDSLMMDSIESKRLPLMITDPQEEKFQTVVD